MLAEVLVSNNVLVEQDDNAALSPAAQPVSVSTLHAVCDTVVPCIAVATDKWSAVTLLTEELEDSEHSGTSSNYVKLYPRNGVFVVSGHVRASEAVMRSRSKLAVTAFWRPCL